jgi:SAM-dependent methyltransferase
MEEEWDHKAELAQIRELWSAEQAHLEGQGGKARKQRHYLGKHLGFEPQVRRHLRALDRMTPYVRGRVLEWGCRHALDSAVLTMRFGSAIECHGADLFPPGLFAPFHEFSGLDYRQLTDPVALPYPDAHFDTIIADGVLEHVEDADRSLAELHRVLRPGGVLLIDALPNRYSYTEAWLRLTGGPAHRRRYSAREIAAALDRHGFELIQVRRVGVLPGLLNGAPGRVRSAYARAGHQIDRAERVLERSPLDAVAATLCVVGRRPSEATPSRSAPVAGRDRSE